MDKKTIIGIVLMSLIFIGYVLYNSKQQAEYQEYLQSVQVEEPVAQEATAVEAEAQIADSLTLATAEQREVNMFGESLVAARSGEVKQIEMKNDYLTIDFTTRGGAMQRVVLEEYTKYAPKDERTEKVTLFDPESAMFDMEFYVKKGLNNVKVNTSEYVFQTEGVRREGDRQVLTMQLEEIGRAHV